MDAAPDRGRYGPEYTPVMVSAIARCSASITRLDARNSASPVASAWRLRAAWSGYAEALQLQGVEIDEIDVFSWGCGLNLPDRPVRATNRDEYADFPNWLLALGSKDALAWRDALPTTVFDPPEAVEHPALVRAIDRARQFSRIDGTIRPWLGMPFALRDQQLSASPLPCLAGGAKALRLKKRPSDADWLALFRSLDRAALKGVDRFDHLERLYRDAQRAILNEYRPGALPALAALSLHRPLLSPQVVANSLNLSVAGASKLLERSVGSGLLVEITKRRTWRIFLTRDLALAFGYVAPKRGRPKSAPPPLPADRDLSEVFAAFDEEMARIDRLLARE